MCLEINCGEKTRFPLFSISRILFPILFRIIYSCNMLWRRILYTRPLYISAIYCFKKIFWSTAHAFLPTRDDFSPLTSSFTLIGVFFLFFSLLQTLRCFGRLPQRHICHQGYINSSQTFVAACIQESWSEKWLYIFKQDIEFEHKGEKSLMRLAQYFFDYVLSNKCRVKQDHPL